MAVYRIKRFTQWDETDNLKRMKDADILAEQKKSTVPVGNMTRAGIGGAIVGSAAGTVLGGFSRSGGSVLKGMGVGAGKGAIIGAGLAAGASYLANRKQAKENNFYNQRLDYAKNQAARRERKDWRNNMVNRDGYSY